MADGVAQRLLADRLTFPGMLPDEILVFRSWLALHEAAYERFDFNVRIGDGVDPGPNFSDAVRRDSILITQLRVDAVGWQGPQATLIEAKRRATPSAVGQLVVYDKVWRAQFPDQPPPKLILVANAFAPNILAATRELDIELDVVQTDFSSLATKKTGPRLSGA